MKLFSFLMALCLAAAPAWSFAQTPAPPPVENAVVAQAEAVYQKELREKVEAPIEPQEKRLSESYRASVDGEAKKAIAQGSLDGALAFQTEAKRFAVENMVPEQDEPGTYAGVAKLRLAWRAEAKRLGQLRAAAQQAALTAYLAKLRALEVELTKAAKIDDALAVRKRSAELAAPAPVATRATPASTPVAATPRALVSTSTLGAVSDKVDLYAVGKDTRVYLNNKVALDHVTRGRPEQARVSLHVGDVITVHVATAFKDHAFWLCGTTPSGDLLFESSPEWHAFLPADRQSWWEIKKPGQDVAAEFVAGVDIDVLQLMKSASLTPCYRGALPIRSPIDDTGSPSAANFFYHVITREDLAPKKIDPATRIDGSAAALPFLGKTVRLVLAGEPTFGVLVEKDEGKLGPLEAAAKGAASFKINKGAEPGTVSFESVASPGFFLSESASMGHLKKGRFQSSHFWIEKAPGGEGYVIAGHLHPNQHFASGEKRLLSFTPSFKDGNDVFLIQEVRGK